MHGFSRLRLTPTIDRKTLCRTYLGQILELRQIEYFIAVAEELNFGRAAQRLHIGQPAVSQQVRRLERELQVQLFDRTSRAVNLTVAGAELLVEARKILKSVGTFSARARGLVGRDGACYRIGSGNALGSRLDDFLDALSHCAPGARTEFCTLSAAIRMERVRTEKLDAAFIRGISTSPGLSLLPLWKDPLLVALPAKHELALHDPIRLNDLAKLPLRLPPRETNDVLHDTVYAACHTAGFEPALGPPSVLLQDTLAEIGAGSPSWTLLYPTARNLVSTRRVALRPLEGTPVAIRMSLAIREDLEPAKRIAFERTSAQIHKTLLMDA